MSKHWLFLSFKNVLSLQTYSLRGQLHSIWTLSHVADTTATPSIMTSLWRGASKREPTTRPSAVTPLVAAWRHRFSPWVAPTSWLRVRERLTDPQSSEGAEQVTAHSKMSQPLHNPCVHFLYHGTAALLPPSPLASFEVFKHGAMCRMTERSEGEGNKDCGDLSQFSCYLHSSEVWIYKSKKQTGLGLLISMHAKAQTYFFEIMLTYARANQ